MTKSKATARGKPKSGRVWKTTRTQRYSSQIKDAGLRTSWEKKMELKALAAERRADEERRRLQRASRREAARLAQEAREQRRKENERKAEVVQPVSTLDQ